MTVAIAYKKMLSGRSRQLLYYSK